MTGKVTYQDDPYGYHLKDVVRDGIQLTLSFTKAAAAAQDDKTENLVISPFNALQCLSMVAAGSAGSSRDEMAEKLFGTDGANLDARLGEFGQLVKDILAANKDSVTLTTAYSTWANSEQVALRDDFVNRLKSMGSEINEVPFSDPTVVDRINEWCSDNTAGNIDEIIQELTPDDVAILASALYFKGDWTHPFKAELTEKKAFTDDAGKVYDTDTMHLDMVEDDNEVAYQKGTDYEAVALTYGKEDYDNGSYPTMRLVLVRPTDAAVSARDWFDGQAGTGKTPAWLSTQFQNVVGSIELPKLDIDQEHDLIPVLESLGVKDVFDGSKADLTPMVVKGAPHISEVKQKVVFKSDEKGSEAAAVTFARVTLESMRMPPKVIDLKFDRSFVFALLDNQSNAVLFTGVVNKPNKAMTPR